MNDLIELLEEIRPDVDFTDTDSLVDGNVLDSFDIINIVGSINDKYGISLEVEDIIPQNFNSLESINNLILKYKK